MPEAITPSSEKLVPIDTTGNAVDVTLKDEEKGVVETTEQDAPIVEVKEETTVEVETPDETEVKEVKETKEEELEEYSATVKKRIDKLTKKMR